MTTVCQQEISFKKMLIRWAAIYGRFIYPTLSYLHLTGRNKNNTYLCKFRI